MQSRYKHNLTVHAGICAVIVLLFNLPAFGEQGKVNWNQFRGPNGHGVAESDRIGVHFGPESNVVWKIPIGAGQSSPVIWNDRIFLTACESGNKNELVTLCIDRKSGKTLWRRIVPAEAKVRFHPMNSAASSTPAVDEKHVYVYSGTYGLVCFDHAGSEVWRRKIDTPKSLYGPATSPILYEDTVILVLDDNGGTSRMIAVNRDTGDTVWEQPRSLFKAGWSTPMIWRHGETDELVVLGFKRLTSYDPSNGEEIWWAGGFSPETVGVPVAAEGLLFVSDAAMAGRGEEKWDADLTWKITVERFDENHDNQIQRSEMTEGFTIPLRPEFATDNPGYGLPVRNMDGLLKYLDKDKDKIISQADWMQTMSGFSMDSRPNLLAVRPGATKDARPSHVVWEIHRGTPETPSVLYCRRRLYLIRSGGLLTCIEAATGEELFSERIGAPGQYIASPVAAGDKIVFASARGIVTVIQADDKLKILANNNFREKIFATPAVAENKIYLRTTAHLYALGK